MLLEEVLDQNEGSWTSPGADVKLFVTKGKDASIKWYAKSQNITVNGDDRADIEVSTTEYYTEGSLHHFSYDFDVTAFRSKFLPPEKFKMAAMFRSGKTAV